MADSGTKKAILHHMNTDHQGSLRMYLRVYCQVSSREAESARLEDLTLNDLLLRTASGTRYTIPLSPPLKSFADARARVVAMHKECLQKLGLSGVVIKEYRVPRGGHAVAFAVCLGVMVAFSRRGNFVPGSWMYETLGLQRAPQAVTLCHDYQPWVLWSLIGAHVLEAAVLAVTRLKPHGVSMFGSVWWMWMGSTVIEGVSAWHRFDGMVKEQKAKQH
ncbi:hypothetical protein FE257_012358 [Aspergillus nanangensis]|uniref:DUF2470 domain-containing protein n=1 Tax=Aspergillus nanangensis TaxID=2582783 RepID=A0AAD4GQR5_ASPNN|nr:hypothetical protein FE257_012358 [Aspergillus nanangensis]